MAAEADEAVVVEVLRRFRLAEALDVVLRGEGVEMHREQPALDEVGLRRAAQADRDVGLAHREVELLVGQDQLDAHVRVEVEELADALREPDRAEPDGRRHLEVAGRPLARLDEARPGGLEAHAHVAGGAEQEVALLGQDQPAGVAVEQRRLELALERADLPAHRRLAEVEIVAGAGEAAGFRDGVEDPNLVPVHGGPRATPSRCYSAA